MKLLIVRQIPLFPDNEEYVYEVDNDCNVAVSQDGTRLTLFRIDDGSEEAEGETDDDNG